MTRGEPPLTNPTRLKCGTGTGSFPQYLPLNAHHLDVEGTKSIQKNLLNPNLVTHFPEVWRILSRESIPVL